MPRYHGEDGSLTVFFVFLATVPPAFEDRRPVCGLQLPRVCEAADEGCVQGAPARRGPAAGAGVDPEGIERAPGVEGGFLSSEGLPTPSLCDEGPAVSMENSRVGCRRCRA